MRVFLTLSSVLIWAISTIPALGQTAEQSPPRRSKILNVLRAEFKKRGPDIDRIELYDIRRLRLGAINSAEKPNHFLILANGGRLWGLFILDDSLFAVEHTVAFMREPDISKQFFFKIEMIRKDSVTVRGFDTQFEDVNFLKRYYLLK